MFKEGEERSREEDRPSSGMKGGALPPPPPPPGGRAREVDAPQGLADEPPGEDEGTEAVEKDD